LVQCKWANHYVLVLIFRKTILVSSVLSAVLALNKIFVTFEQANPDPYGTVTYETYIEDIYATIYTNI